MASNFDNILKTIGDNKGALTAILGAGAGAAALGGYLSSKTPRKRKPDGRVEDRKERRSRILKNALGTGAAGAGAVGLMGLGASQLASAVPDAPEADKEGLLSAAGRNVGIPVGASAAAHKWMLGSGKAQEDSLKALLNSVNRSATEDHTHTDSKGKTKTVKNPRNVFSSTNVLRTSNTHPSAWGVTNTHEWDADTFRRLAKDDPTFIRKVSDDLKKITGGNISAGGNSKGLSIDKLFRNAGQTIDPVFGRKSTSALVRFATGPATTKGTVGSAEKLLRGAAGKTPNVLRSILGKVNPGGAKSVIGSAAIPALAWMLQNKYLAPEK